MYIIIAITCKGIIFIILNTNLCVNIKIHGMYVVTVEWGVMGLYTLEMDC